MEFGEYTGDSKRIILNERQDHLAGTAIVHLFD
jgi:hypothetical protein